MQKYTFGIKMTNRISLQCVALKRKTLSYFFLFLEVEILIIVNW
jgi:hypothetical protein